MPCCTSPVEKVCSTSLRYRLWLPKPLPAASPNAHQGGLSDRACVACPGASPARSGGASSCSVGLVTGRATHARSARPPWCAFGEAACAGLGCRCRWRRHFEPSFFAIATESTRRKTVTALTWPFEIGVFDGLEQIDGLVKCWDPKEILVQNVDNYLSRTVWSRPFLHWNLASRVLARSPWINAKESYISSAKESYISAKEP